MALIKLNDQSLSAVTSAGLPSGSVLQVQSTTKTDTWSGTPGVGVFLDITGLSVDITPSSTTSKILVTFSANVSASGNSTTGVRLMRDSTAISVGDAAGNRPLATTGGGGNEGDNWHGDVLASSFLDSPSTTSSVTYKLQLIGNSTATQYVNRKARDTNSAGDDYRMTSHITVMEIAG
jgi:hypothetical protein